VSIDLRRSGSSTRPRPSDTEADYRAAADPAADAAALKITDWKNNGHPKLGKRALTMSNGDVARSLAATPDRSRFVLGTEFTLRLYDKSGDEIAHVELPSPAWTTAISRDGTRVIAALGDGTIRWFSLEKERAPLSQIVAFFPHRDGKRWVAWTPEGFFDRSNDGGGEFVGGQVRRKLLVPQPFPRVELEDA